MRNRESPMLSRRKAQRQSIQLFCGVAEAGIRQYDARRHAGRQRGAYLIERDLRLRRVNQLRATKSQS